MRIGELSRWIKGWTAGMGHVWRIEAKSVSFETSGSLVDAVGYHVDCEHCGKGFYVVNNRLVGVNMKVAIDLDSSSPRQIRNAILRVITCENC